LLPASALRQRTLTALALGPLVLAGALWLNTGWLAVGLALVVVLAAWEWTALAGLKRPSVRLAYLAVIGFGCAALWRAHLWGWAPYVLIPVALGWLLVLVHLARVVEVPRAQGTDLGLLAVGLPVMLGPWLALVHLDALRPNGPLLVLFLLLLIWGADIAAYFAGRRWGRVKLAPVLSPGKTWAGGYGALAAAALCGLALAWLLGVGVGRALALIAICILTAVVSVAGDLFESLLKRRRGLKDSGRLLPGHGGVLDRIDSMTAAAPVFALGLHLLL
jgi:phosphatidate cytidylyltransferase